MGLVIYSCAKDHKEEAIKKDSQDELFTLLNPDSTGIKFFNEVINQKNFNIFKYRNFYNGGGVAIGDINNDGLPDIYLTANMGKNKLYLNKGNLKFEDISKSAGIEGDKPWSTGVAMADINQDGYLDIYVSNAGNLEGNNHDNELYINNGDLTFTEQAKSYNLAETGFSTHASFFDYDKDGDLDAYILNNSNIPVSSLGYAHQRDKRAQDWENVPHIFRGVGDMLLRNDNGKYVDVSEEAGIYGSLIGFGLGVMITDINNDLYPDIYISNDFYERDYLYINNQDGTFNEEIKKWTSHLSLSAMGVDIQDINNDGHSDIFITDMLPDPDQRIKSVMEFEGYDVYKLKQSKDFYQQYIQNTLQLNNGNGSFSEIANFSGISKTDWSWSGLIFDMDNDGYKDIFVTNGINHDLTDLDFVDFFANEIIQKMALTGKKQAIDSIIEKMPQTPLANYAFKNNKDLTFDNKTNDWGFSKPSFSNGAAYGDLDNDGDLDLVVNNVNMDSFIYENNSDKLLENNYLKIKLNGNQANKFAIGASIKVYADHEVFTQEQIPSRGFQSSVDYVLSFGLGKISTIDSIRVIWPSNKTKLLKGIETNQTLVLNESDAEEIYKPVKSKNEIRLLEEIDHNLMAHDENVYTDFDHEGLISSKVSQEGPAFAKADINGDGYEDIFIGGAKNQPSAIYLNNAKGNFKLKPITVFQEDYTLEDTAAAFFDADNDGDLDLMVGNSGNEANHKQIYGVRLYINDGNGNFSRSNKDLPYTNNNISDIAPYDFDNDGDIDVFVASRSVVNTYAIDPEHLFLENTGNGEFRDATERYAYDVKDAGMITKAIWEDVDGDSKKDLITVSDWGSPNIFKNTGRNLTKIETNLNDYHGWWKTVIAEDIDNDGDIDLVLGNQGSNTLYKATQENPMKLWINDYDDNGTIEQICTTTIDGGDYPLHMKKELTNQIVSLKKQNLKASDYAKKTINELFSKEIIQNTLTKKANTMESIIAFNDGNGNYTIKKLPPRTQLSSVNSILVFDINKDGHKDIITGGNNFEFKPQFSRLDANYGSVLLNDGKNNFEWQEYSKSGFFVKDEVKHLSYVENNAGNNYVLVLINDEKPKIFELNN
jgi:hypothetical protein